MAEIENNYEAINDDEVYDDVEGVLPVLPGRNAYDVIDEAAMTPAVRRPPR